MRSTKPVQLTRWKPPDAAAPPCSYPIFTCGRNCSALAIWGAATVSAPARSAIVRASLSTRWKARAENCSRWAATQGMDLLAVKQAEAKRGFVLPPRRWVVARSFAWDARFRRVARD